MRDDVRDELVGRLGREYGFQDKRGWLRKGRCPSCGRLELFARADAPWLIRCSRETKCGWSAHVKDLYPEVFEGWSNRYPATTTDPQATADMYMSHVRGLDIREIRHWWRQGHFRHQHGNRQSATVVFELTVCGVAPRSVWMERLIDPVTITTPGAEPEVRKAHFVGSHQGLWWQPPGFELVDGEELWLVEGCIDAIALHLHGIKAVAVLSAYNYPDRALAELLERGVRPRLVWALDNDPTGRKRIEKNVKTAQAAGYACAAALIPQRGKKTDWNDAHLTDKLGAAELDEYRFQGNLFLAESALEKGVLLWRRRKSISFSLEHDTRTWWWDLPQTPYAAMVEALNKEGGYADEGELREEAARRTANVQEIANVSVQFLYFQKNALTDESWYYVRIRFPHGRYEVKDTFTGAQVATASEFKKRLLAIAPGALFTGATWQLNWLIKHHLDNIKIVDTVDFIGYSKQHKAWIFPKIAVAGGKVYDLNSEDFFEIGPLTVKSLNHSLHLHIGRRMEYRPDWIDLVWLSFGPKGIVAAAFWLGSLFAEQLRDQYKSYPFLEIVGEAGAGKSTLIEALWKLVGRADYEGFDPNKSTLAARARIMSQVANLPVSFIESDRGDADSVKQRQFDWDELKTAYNGRASRATGVANSGNDTREPLFKGAILISQNAPVNASDAIMQRIVHEYLDTSNHNAVTKNAADTLASLPVEAMSWFLVHAISREAAVLKKVAERMPVHEAELLQRPTIKHVRIAKNHAQIMALVEALGDLTDMPHDQVDATLAALSRGAEQRQAAIASDHPVVEDWWDLVEYLGIGQVNHTADPETIALNLNHVVALAGKAAHPVPPILDLKRHLKGSRSFPFVTVKAVRSTLFDGRTVKCWVFKNTGAR